MNEFVKMDVFFVISSVATVVLTILLIVLLIYMIKFFRNLKHISEVAKIEADNLSGDLKDLRGNIRSTGFKFKHLFNFFESINNRNKKGK